jgi:hypothetical protein
MSLKRGQQRALAATGLVATAAAAGLGVAAVTAAEAQAASGVVHACYNKSTHALKYSKKASCPNGSKLVTWNKQGRPGAPGAQGAQGPQGAQGATGAGAGYADTKVRFPLSGPGLSISDSSSPVASFTPTSAGDFAVNAFADLATSGAAWCWVHGGTGSGNSTGTGFTDQESRLVNVTTTGIVFASPGAPIVEECFGGSHTSIYSTAVTGVRLTAGHTTLAGKHGRPSAAAARTEWQAMKNRFQKRAK